MAEYFRVSVNTHDREWVESLVRIYPLVCWHIGAKQSDGSFIKQTIKQISGDENALWVYMGDGGECVTKLSKGDLYSQVMTPQEQHDRLVELLGPISSKGLFGIRGNHGHRIYKETGLDFDKNLCHRLGIPYLGVAAFVNLVVNRSSYDLFFHHGIDSGVPLAIKIRKSEAFGSFIDADAIFTAHSHIAVDLPPLHLLTTDNVNKKVVTKLRHQYICGSAYDSRSGYAEDKGYPPLLPSRVVVTFDGRIVAGQASVKQSCSIIRSTADYEITSA